MKTELKAKFLQTILRNKKENEGFTLIELLVVIIIIGILSAIALPSFLNQANKARQSEAKQFIGSINRAQQAYYLGNNNEFTTVLTELSLGIRPNTDNYVYDIGGAKTASEYVTNKARAKARGLKSYAGVVYTSEQDVSGVKELITQAITCEAITPLAKAEANGQTVPEARASKPECPALAGGMKTIR
ncbi:prepilin-type N-terminal cleavage/methylation domain-containing protein [Rivularia sp. PCC 7116]|uniref:type IV pilin-like G/H family protein n=1 Tax=Rivularia sp. PCC 7116 TaxID=373994 RepID=UPI00029F39C8|nr:type IV pilin-like G/H family protein [Rivularia sp. PCC 7116]AFY56297.1 prepilin-type N-terminal cleavage/methylation domain-containing protein [Rivularia sp. PCC 7116]